MFTSMPKIQFIIHFFPKTLYFKESYNLIGQQQLENQNFGRYEIGVETSKTILVLILDNFQEELKRKFFKRSEKPYFGCYFGPFSPKFGKMNFPLKKGLCQFFKYFNYLPSCKKSEKTNDPFLIQLPN